MLGTAEFLTDGFKAKIEATIQKDKHFTIDRQNTFYLNFLKGKRKGYDAVKMVGDQKRIKKRSKFSKLPSWNPGGFKNANLIYFETKYSYLIFEKFSIVKSKF